MIRPASAKIFKTEKSELEKSAASVVSHSGAGQQQLAELRSWIEQQMRNENMFEVMPSAETTMPKDHPKSIFD